MQLDPLSPSERPQEGKHLSMCSTAVSSVCSRIISDSPVMSGCEFVTRDLSSSLVVAVGCSYPPITAPARAGGLLLPEQCTSPTGALTTKYEEPPAVTPVCFCRLKPSVCEISQGSSVNSAQLGADAAFKM